eukprot:9460263-Heterocapsa_arctica.AAC.1
MEEGDTGKGQGRARRWDGTSLGGSAEGGCKDTEAERRKTLIGEPSARSSRPAPEGRTRGADL